MGARNSGSLDLPWVLTVDASVLPRICHAALLAWWEVERSSPSLQPVAQHLACELAGLKKVGLRVHSDSCIRSDWMAYEWAEPLLITFKQGIVAGLNGEVVEACVPVECAPEALDASLLLLQVWLQRAALAVWETARDGLDSLFKAHQQSGTTCVTLVSTSLDLVERTMWKPSNFCCEKEDNDCETEFGWFKEAATRVALKVLSFEATPNVFKYADKPEFERCPVASVILKLHNMLFHMVRIPSIRKTKWELLDRLYAQVMNWSWAELIESGWGAPLFALLHEASMTLCSSDVADSLANTPCASEAGLPLPRGELFEQIQEGSSMQQQFHYVISKLQDAKWKIMLLSDAMVVPQKAALTYCALQYIPDRQRDIEAIQHIFLWSNDAGLLDDRKRYTHKTISSLADLLFTSWMIFPCLGVLSLALLTSDLRAPLNPCESCQSKWNWQSGNGLNSDRVYKPISPCIDFATARILPRTNARIVGVSLAELPGSVRELEWMIDFYDPSELRATREDAGDEPDVCGYQWEIDLARLRCHFDDGTNSPAWVVSPASAAAVEKMEGGPRRAIMVPGPPVGFGCRVPDGLTFPTFVEIRDADRTWGEQLIAELCKSDEQQVPLAVCTRGLHSMADSPLLDQWLEYHLNLGLGHIFLYDQDGTAREVVEHLPKDRVTYFPMFYSRGEQDVCRQLQQEGRWAWHWNRWDPSMGCHMLQINHCLMYARGRAKYVIWIRAPDKWFASNWTTSSLKELVGYADNLAASVAPRALASVSIATYDYWSPKPCSPKNCVEVHHHFSMHPYLAHQDDYVNMIDPTHVWGMNSHQPWPREDGLRLAAPTKQFWIAHYLVAFATTPEKQARMNASRWRYKLCADDPTEKHCATIRVDGTVAGMFRKLIKNKTEGWKYSSAWTPLQKSLASLLETHRTSLFAALSEAAYKDIDEVFRAWDRDANGSLDRDEFVNGLETLAR